MSINEIMRALNESTQVKKMNEVAEIVFNSKTQPIKSGELYDVCEDILIFPKSDDTPVPWDCEIEVKGKNLILHGHVGPSGFGKCTVEVPLERVSQVYKFEVMPGRSKDDLERFCDEAGIILK